MTKPNIHAVHRDWDREFPIIERTEGIYLYDSQGRRYIDGSGGSSSVTNIGHGVLEVSQAMAEQAQKFSFYPAHAFSNQPFLDLADLVVSLAPGKLKDKSRVWVTCTGTDATDDAVRLSRQYWVESGRPSKYQIISRWQAFHGNTISVAGFSGITGRRSLFQPMYIDSPHIPPAFCYRCPFEQTYPDCNLLCARALETAIRQQNPDNVAAFIAEPVVGAALACVPAPDGYFQIIREICTKYDVLFIDDEVQTGWGRTGAQWAIDYWGVTPDIIATAKGMTAGYTPLSAIIAKDEIWSVLEKKHSSFKAGHTLNANAVSCVAALVVINYLLDHKLAENSKARGEQFRSGLTAMMSRHPSLGDVRGKGLLSGFELVKSRGTKEPFDQAKHASVLLERAALQRGLVIYPCTGSVEGVAGDMVLMAPPLVINVAEIDEVLQILDDSLSEVEADLGVK
ncbi:MAG: aminotransferase class III-fold pyridoxal phosphate-dependent enzyme [Anaerolineales bacterium]|jgi:adenosylmethionine-8-amino-7-oxononanoate aminotransferase